MFSFGKLMGSNRQMPGDPDEFRLTLVEHLEELRDRIIRSISILTVTSIIGWWQFANVYNFLQQVVDRAVKDYLPKGTPYTEVFLNTTDAFFLKLKLSFQIGIVLAFPFLVLQLWGFLAPALKPQEQKPFRQLAPLSLLLFIMGAGFCWFILPSGIGFFMGFSGDFKGVEINQEAGRMVFFMLKMMLAFGISFQLPLVVYALGMMELLTAESLIKYWRQAGTFIFVAAALITPSGDAFSMLMMAVPMVILFALSVFFVNLTQKRRRRERAELEADRDAPENRPELPMIGAGLTDESDRDQPNADDAIPPDANYDPYQILEYPTDDTPPSSPTDSAPDPSGGIPNDLLRPQRRPNDPDEPSA
ncbi:MAG: twin-arginine translocase subunit TatC [Fimbriimonadaceae bacterium]|nr:twin-arginine translocase subunit TatC [Fimbriimonadaceae bacterium]